MTIISHFTNVILILHCRFLFSVLLKPHRFLLILLLNEVNLVHLSFEEKQTLLNNALQLNSLEFGIQLHLQELIQF